MSTVPTESTVRTQPRRLTLSQYVRQRNGVAMGASGSLSNMFHRSLGAGSFAGFWRYWNPIWGYALARLVFQPLKRALPPAAALITTFVICGAIHDLAILAVRGFMTFLFMSWFLVLGVGVVLGARVEYSSRPWLIRACVNLVYLGACLAVSVMARRFFEIP